MVCYNASDWFYSGFINMVNLKKNSSILLIFLFFSWISCSMADELSKSEIKFKKCRPCSHKPNVFKSTSKLLRSVWTEGKNELYIPAYAWHNRFTYSSNRIGRYNENPWGGGLGKSYYDEKGDWHGLYAFAFLDSHKYLEPIVGYAFLKIIHLPKDINLGGGYGLLVTQRPDINNGIPFPGALPWVSVNRKKVSVVAAYVPGTKNIGNVLFVICKIVLA